ncbi:hypothetical protein ERO13_A06G116300v2 [Gossypium hirsutum]|uniref:Uncharacterized protein isoform X1 n=1 Tax=Gossypium hirsutum TaxID=3635 RepID=A0A1U8PU76_GOSHI|nr:uncharacterized protein LOC107962158 isoform X1 [Gossypium hirsutum]KAG4195557.1 hypothetical protein ERO13_A06G116300v2 [Gossypium hirsutum]
MWIAATSTSSSTLSFFQIQCSDSNRKRGFGPRKSNQKATSKEEKGFNLQQRKSASKQSGPSPAPAPGLSVQFDGKSNSHSLDIDFEERLEAIRRAALEQKKVEEQKEYGPIDYDAPVESEKKTIGLGTKIGVGIAVAVFGLVFTLGDFLPGSVNPPEEAAVIDKKLSREQKAILETRLAQFEATLSTSPKDETALEGAAVTLTELGDYARATSLLQELAKVKTSDPEVFRLLGEVKYELKDYDGSAAAYKLSAAVSKDVDFEVLRGYTNALLAAKRPAEAVQFLLSSRECLNMERSTRPDPMAESSKMETEAQNLDPIQVDLLLGKAYSDWGHVSDAVAIYDQLISSNPNDFRGYLAKGIILKENGNVGDAERMFIQARFFAPETAKALVDRYSRQ